MNRLADALNDTRDQRLPAVGQSTLQAQWRRLICTLAEKVSVLREKRNQHRDIKELQALSDRMLNDIGLHRGNIESFVHTGSVRDQSSLFESTPTPPTPASTQKCALAY